MKKSFGKTYVNSFLGISYIKNLWEKLYKSFLKCFSYTKLEGEIDVKFDVQFIKNHSNIFVRFQISSMVTHSGKTHSWNLGV